MHTLDLYLTAQRGSVQPGWLSDSQEVYNDEGVDHGTMVLHNPDAYGMPDDVVQAILLEDDWETEYAQTRTWMFENGWVRFWSGYGYAGFDMPNFSAHYTRMVRDFLLEHPIAVGGEVALHSYEPKLDVSMSYREFVFEEQEPGRGQALGCRAEIDKKNLVMMTHRKAQAMSHATDQRGRQEFRVALNTLRRLGLAHLV